jgi:holo-[acyl-carrier protein] synthase
MSALNSDVAVPEAQDASGRIRCGIDVVELKQFRRALIVGGERFLRNIFTAFELMECSGDVQRLAALFAAKEAVAKALGTGIRGIGWSEIEVVASNAGPPQVHLTNRAKERAAKLSIAKWTLSLSHTSSVALAAVVAEGLPKPQLQKGAVQ